MIERVQSLEMFKPPVIWRGGHFGAALPRPEKLAGGITIAHGLFQLVLMWAFHGWDGFGIGVAAADAVIGIGLLAGSDMAATWLRIRVGAGLLLFAPGALLMGDFAGFVILLTMSAGQYALVTPDFREALGSRRSFGLAVTGLTAGFGLCVAHGLGVYTPTPLA